MKKFFVFIISLIILSLLTSCRAMLVKKYESDVEQEYTTEYGTENYYKDQNVQVLDKQSDFQEISSYCDECIANGYYIEALNYSKQKAEEDSRYHQIYTKCANLYMEKIITEAGNYAANRDFIKAIEILEEGNKVYHCAEFSEAIKTYQNCLPRKLQNCHVIDSAGYNYGYFENSVYDCFGNEYSSPFGFHESYDWSYHSNSYVVFFLDGKYTNLSGIFAARNYLGGEIKFEIYGDEELLYESPWVGRTTYPININIDVTGIRQLKIRNTYSDPYANSTTVDYDHDGVSIYDFTVS